MKKSIGIMAYNEEVNILPKKIIKKIKD